ncbi:MAG: sugar phosphate isomerase/epimerase family protein [Limnochordia bacterium]
MPEFSFFARGLDDYANMISNLQRDGIECATLNHLQNKFIAEADEEELARIGGAFEGAGIVLRALHAPFSTPESLAHEDEDMRLKNVAFLAQVIQKLPFLGVDIVHVHPTHKPTSEGSLLDSQIDVFSRSLESLLPIAERCRVRIAIENMPYAPGSTADVCGILERFNSPWLGICFDTGHGHVFGDIKEEFSMAEPFLVDFHVNDNGGRQDAHLPPPYGTIDWLWFQEAVQRSGFSGPITIEALPWGKAGWDNLVLETKALFSGSLLTCPGPEGKAGYVHCRDCGHVVVVSPAGWSCCCVK